MGHVIEFGHSLVLERLDPGPYQRWWCGVDSGTSSRLRAVEVYEPYKVAAGGSERGQFYRRQDNVAKDVAGGGRGD